MTTACSYASLLQPESFPPHVRNTCERTFPSFFFRLKSMATFWKHHVWNRKASNSGWWSTQTILALEWIPPRGYQDTAGYLVNCDADLATVVGKPPRLLISSVKITIFLDGLGAFHLLNGTTMLGVCNIIVGDCPPITNHELTIN